MLRDILSLLVGFYLGYLIGSHFLFNLTVKYHGPNSNNIRKEIYQDKKDSCYKMEPVVHICPISFQKKSKK